MLEQEQKPTLQEYWKGFPEAPFSDTFKWIDADGFEHMTTVRGWGDKSLNEGILKAKALIEYNGGKPAGKAAPMPTAESQKIQATTEDGLPIVNGQTGEPEMVPLPQGVHLFTVKEVYHDTNKDGDKHMLKVVINEQEYQFSNKKYGVSCFHPGPEFTGWMDWTVGNRFAPPVKAAKVLIRDPKPGGKYADVVGFRS